MRAAAGSDFEAGGGLASWYRRLSASERLTLALSLSLVVHAIVLALPGPPPHPARAPGALSVLLPPSAASNPPLSGERFRFSDTPLPSLPSLPARPRLQWAGSGDEPLQMLVKEEVAASEPLAMPAGASAPSAMLPVSELPGVEAGGYFPATALDVLAQPLQPIVFVLPPDAPAGEARLMVRVYINEQGGVDAVEPEQPDPSGVVEREARRVFLQIRFAPAQRHGLAVKSYKRIEVRMQN